MHLQKCRKCSFVVPSLKKGKRLNIHFFSQRSNSYGSLCFNVWYGSSLFDCFASFCVWVTLHFSNIKKSLKKFLKVKFWPFLERTLTDLFHILILLFRFPLTDLTLCTEICNPALTSEVRQVPSISLFLSPFRSYAGRICLFHNAIFAAVYVQSFCFTKHQVKEVKMQQK